ncbi:hypothetical protein QYM36_014555 [Artemia franciscana]|uniref:PH domain-containing protein n=1 Tax=Artemia franciscana TaxID=6661 RepID=A0AA88HEP7_ARTSF|nr:hypothetical protein QYM36_014555 [Artemia franciscana]
MKLNEKMLSNLATSFLTPVDKEGWLMKRGEVNRTFLKRWFVLKGNLLFYFDKKFDKEPVGVIILEGCTVELAEEESCYCFKIVFSGPNTAGLRTYVLGTETQQEAENWMKMITCASYDYLKVMVAELQRQVDELTGHSYFMFFSMLNEEDELK